MSELRLPSLEIQNFRAFRDLRIEKLGRVNLIVGKNSVGKTCLLEALFLYTRQGHTSAIQEILISRDEYEHTNRRFADESRRFTPSTTG